MSQGPEAAFICWGDLTMGSKTVIGKVFRDFKKTEPALSSQDVQKDLSQTTPVHTKIYN